MTLKELRERRGALEARAKSIVNRAESEDRELSPEELVEIRDINSEDISLQNRIASQEHMTQWGRELDTPVNNRISGRGSHVGDSFGGELGSRTANDLDMAVAAFSRNAHGASVDPSLWDGAERYGYRPGSSGLGITMAKSRPTIGSALNLFQSPYNSLSSNVPSRGGITIPAGFGPEFETALKMHGPMLRTSTIWSTDDGRPAAFPQLDDTSEEGELLAESAPATESELVFSGTMLSAYKLSSKVVKVPTELIEDSAIALASEVGKALGARLGRGANRLLTTGSGANSPRGIVPSSTLGKETASATAIAADEILDLIASVDAAYRELPTCGFLMSDFVFSYLGKLKDGYGRYLLDQLSDPLQPRIRGFRVHVNNHMSTALEAGAKSVLFGDLARYKVRLVREIRLRTLQELYAQNDQVGFLGFMRLDGCLIDAGTHPVKHLLQKAS